MLKENTPPFGAYVPAENEYTKGKVKICPQGNGGCLTRFSHGYSYCKKAIKTSSIQNSPGGESAFFFFWNCVHFTASSCIQRHRFHLGFLPASLLTEFDMAAVPHLSYTRKASHLSLSTPKSATVLLLLIIATTIYQLLCVVSAFLLFILFNSLNYPIK